MHRGFSEFGELLYLNKIKRIYYILSLVVVTNPVRNGWVVAACQLATKQLNSV